MSINFKIYFEQKNNEKNNIVLLKGDLLKFTWESLKEKMITNSNHLYFKSNNLSINKKDIFILKIIDEKYVFNNINEIFDERTFDFLLNNLKEIKDEIQEETIKFNLVKVKEVPKNNLKKFDIILKESLNNNWNIEKERINNELDEVELTKSYIDHINKFYNENKSSTKQHKNIICNKCFKKNFFGPRYVCAYCNNYNLCYFCYKKFDHEPEHNFMIIRYPLRNQEYKEKKENKDNKENEENIIKYNNSFVPNIHLFHNVKSSFKIKFNLINTGNHNLKDCFITYIKFNDNSLICQKYIIEEDFNTNNKKEIELEIKFKDFKEGHFRDDYHFDYEGHFRMFNKDGIPFGNILIVKIHNDSLRNI